MKILRPLFIAILLLSLLCSCDSNKASSENNLDATQQGDTESTTTDPIKPYIIFDTGEKTLSYFKQIEEFALYPNKLENYHAVSYEKNGNEIIHDDLYDLGYSRADGIWVFYSYNEISNLYNFFKSISYVTLKDGSPLQTDLVMFEPLSDSIHIYRQQYIKDGICYCFFLDKTSQVVDMSNYDFADATEFAGQNLKLFVDPNPISPPGANFETYNMVGYLYFGNYRLCIQIGSFNTRTSGPQLSATEEFVKNNWDLDQFEWKPIYE